MVMEPTEPITRFEFRRYVWGCVVAFVVILLSAGYVLSTKADINSLGYVAIANCDRVNILRAQSNLNDLVSFNILSAAAQGEVAEIKRDPRNAAIHRATADRYTEEANTLTFAALTDCPRAIKSPNTAEGQITAQIGNAKTGEIRPDIRVIIRASQKLVARNEVTE